MVLYAVEALDDAFDLTRELLTPFDAGRWAKLALVTFFVGTSGANLSGFQGSVGGDAGGPPPGDVPPVDVGPELWAFAAVVVGVVLLVATAFAAISAIMEFVFVESLSARSVTLRRYWRRRWRQGLRLLGFRIALGLLVLGGLALVVTPIAFAALDVAIFATWLTVLALVVLVPLFILLATVVGLVNGFTTVFVVPIMIRDDCGVLAGWRRLWPTITSHWKQYLAYAVAGFLLSIAGGILVATATGLLAFLVLLPLSIPAGFGFAMIAADIELLGIAVLALTALLFALALFVIVAFVQVPVQSYLRYYALLVLGDVEPEYDLIPEQRAAVRELPEG